MNPVDIVERKEIITKYHGAFLMKSEPKLGIARSRSLLLDRRSSIRIVVGLHFHGLRRLVETRLRRNDRLLLMDDRLRLSDYDGCSDFLLLLHAAATYNNNGHHRNDCEVRRSVKLEPLKEEEKSSTPKWFQFRYTASLYVLIGGSIMRGMTIRDES